MTIEKVARAFAWSLVAKVAAFVAGFAANILIVRSLGAHGWGVLSELKTITGFVLVIVMLGMDTALLRFLPVLRVAGGLRAFFRTFRGLVMLQVGVWLALLVLGRFSGSVLGVFFRGQGERFGLYVQVAIGFVLVEIFMLLATNVFQSWYETKRLGIVMIWGNAFYIGFLVLALRLKFGIVGILASSASANVIMLFMLMPRLKSLVRSVPDSGTPVAPAAVLRFALPFVVTGLLNQIVWRQSEVIFLGHFRGAEEAGFFSLAYRTPQLLLEFVPLTIWPIVMAGTSEVYAKSEGNLPRAVDLYFKLLYMLVVPVAAMGFAFSRPLVPMLYGREMLPAALVTQLFFVVFSYSFLYTPMSMALYVMGKSWVNMLIFLLLACINVGLDLVLIPRYGVWGALAPVSFALMLAVVLFHVVMRRWRRDVKTPALFIARCYAAAVPTSLLAIATARVSSPVAIATLIPVGLALLVLGFRWMKVIGPAEKELIRLLPIPAKERVLSLF
jgi:O-antigen/teichoic acid export membrane protein